MKFATKPPQQYPSYLRHVTTLPSDIKNSNFLQIFSRYGKNANKLHFQCTDFNSSVCITLCLLSVLCVFITILSSLLNAMLIVNKHCSDICCDEFPVPQTDRKSKQVIEQWHGKFRYLKHRTYQNLWMNRQ